MLIEHNCDPVFPTSVNPKRHNEANCNAIKVQSRCKADSPSELYKWMCNCPNSTDKALAKKAPIRASRPSQEPTEIANDDYKWLPSNCVHSFPNINKQHQARRISSAKMQWWAWTWVHTSAAKNHHQQHKQNTKPTFFFFWDSNALKAGNGAQSLILLLENETS